MGHDSLNSLGLATAGYACILTKSILNYGDW